MLARITFRSEVYVEGKTIAHIKKKFEQMDLYNKTAEKENELGFIEINTVEDGETYDDLKEYWDNL